MAALASFKTFLNTGHLGPMRPGLSMNEVAVLLGPPPGWIANGDAFGPAPSYWQYNFLEINFRCDTDFRCDWFQIENASSLRDDAVKLADDLFMSLDGLSGEASVSRFIEAIDDLDRVQVYCSVFPPDRNTLVRIDETVEIWFDGSEALKDAVRDGADHATLVRLIEAESEVNSIYSYREPDVDSLAYSRERFGALDHLRVTGRQFLAALRP